MSPRLVRLAYAASAGTGVGFVHRLGGHSGSISCGAPSPDPTSSRFTRQQALRGESGSAVYDLAQQKQLELQITGQAADRFIVLPYFHPALLHAAYRAARRAELPAGLLRDAAFNLLLGTALIVLLVRSSLSIHGRSAFVASR